MVHAYSVAKDDTTTTTTRLLDCKMLCVHRIDRTGGGYCRRRQIGSKSDTIYCFSFSFSFFFIYIICGCASPFAIRHRKMQMVGKNNFRLRFFPHTHRLEKQNINNVLINLWHTFLRCTLGSFARCCSRAHVCTKIWLTLRRQLSGERRVAVVVVDVENDDEQKKSRIKFQDMGR